MFRAAGPSCAIWFEMFATVAAAMVRAAAGFDCAIGAHHFQEVLLLLIVLVTV